MAHAGIVVLCALALFAEGVFKVHKMIELKGNFCMMNQGGTQRDDWLLRVLPHGRWHKVTIRTWPDAEAMKVIRTHLPERVYWGDMARYVQDHPNVPTLSAVEFVKRFVKEQ